MNLSVELKWKQTEEAILRKIENYKDVQCEIPSWEPVDLNMGMRWLKSSIYEGFSVTHEVINLGNRVKIKFNISEPDCD